jgi:acyl-CoA thioesterase FadM
MGYDPTSMVERGVLWAEDQDPFNHVMHSQYMHFFGTCFHRVMESYDQWLNEEEYTTMFQGKGVIPVISSYKMDIKRQVKYPDAVRAALHITQTRANLGIANRSLSRDPRGAKPQLCRLFTVLTQAAVHCCRS